MDGRSTLTWYSSTRIDPELFPRKINTMLWLDRQPEEMMAAIRPVRPSPTRLDIPVDSPAKCLPCSTRETDSFISAVISDVLFEFDLAETLVARHTGSGISIVSHYIDMHVARNIRFQVTLAVATSFLILTVAIYIAIATLSPSRMSKRNQTVTSSRDLIFITLHSCYLSHRPNLTSVFLLYFLGLAGNSHSHKPRSS
jgi:hypothetical protein